MKRGGRALSTPTPAGGAAVRGGSARTPRPPYPVANMCDYRYPFRMEIIAEIGNTSIGVALFAGEKLVHLFRVATHRARSEGDAARAYQGDIVRGLADAGATGGGVKAAAVISVVPSVTEAVVHGLGLALASEVVPAVITVKDAYRVRVRGGVSTREIGTDLVANGEGAVARLGRGPVLVVDFGTALSVTAVNGDNTICGVSIAPGVVLAGHALAGGAAQLDEIGLELPGAYLGTDTVGAVRSGIMYGYIGMITQLVTGMGRELWGEGRGGAVLATGGQSCGLEKHIAVIDEYIPELTAEGVREMAVERRRRLA